MRSTAAVARTALLSPPRSQRIMETETASLDAVAMQKGHCEPNCSTHGLLRSSSISASRCIEVKERSCKVSCLLIL